MTLARILVCWETQHIYGNLISVPLVYFGYLCQTDSADTALFKWLTIGDDGSEPVVIQRSSVLEMATLVGQGLIDMGVSVTVMEDNISFSLSRGRWFLLFGFASQALTLSRKK